ncbi:MAG: hypothetical protein U0792_09610 [Gemmataceae bacterium]
MATASRFHKEAAAEIAAQKEETVIESGAANTLIQMSDGSFSAYNTDSPSIVESIKAHLEERAQDEPAAQLNSGLLHSHSGGRWCRTCPGSLHKEGAS